MGHPITPEGKYESGLYPKNFDPPLEFWQKGCKKLLTYSFLPIFGKPLPEDAYLGHP